MVERLDESNALLYAAKHYDNPNCFDTVEFYEDLNRFKYIKRLLNKYQESGDLKEQLIINHLTIIYNVFGVEAGTRLLFLKLKDHWVYIKPFLMMMGTCPEIVRSIGVDNKDIDTTEIQDDENITKILGKLNG